ncbi:MAG TPA: transglycosylase SLT domain-containing protein [Solirubrobacterales bacterium]
MHVGLRRLVRVTAPVALSLVLAGCGGASNATATSPHDVASQLAENDASLRSAIDSWRAAADPPSTQPPEDVTDRAEYLEAQVRSLARHPNLAAAVIPMLPASLAREVRQLTAAANDLQRLSAGTPPRKLKTGLPPPLADLVAFYGEAHDRYGIGPHYLAAIHLVETKFGRVKSESIAGAKGPMQFIPSTWAIYGNGGDIHDPHDAILAAANLLHHNGAPPRYGRALRAYNPSGLYVDAVTRYAKEIARNPYALYTLYCWQP